MEVDITEFRVYSWLGGCMAKSISREAHMQNFVTKALQYVHLRISFYWIFKPASGY